MCTYVDVYACNVECVIMCALPRINTIPENVILSAEQLQSDYFLHEWKYDQCEYYVLHC